jgi:cytochrome c553
VRRLLAVVAGTLALAGVTRAACGYPPRVNYQLQCMGCHRADGSGEEGRVPSLRRSLVLLSGSQQGRRYVLRVPGVAQAPLSDEDTAALLNWMARNLSDLPVPNDFVAYSVAEVARFRHQPLAATMATRARLLNAAAR